MSELILEANIYTKELVGASITITKNDGVRAISVLASSGAGTVEGGVPTLGGVASSAINLAEGDSYGQVALEGSVLNNITITAVGTLQVTAQI